MSAEKLAFTRLKSLELQGYKTFASKVLFEFSPSITTVVGPNGSGKSNIADAIRWVLGEQSYSLLRGRKTDDMIFTGTEARPRASMAMATITFDNSDGWLPIDFSEVSVGRRAYRDGQNEYLLNGQKVRLKDVSELLAETGLSERTYTIIGQGLVDAALALKADERRRLFEEAAGIELYRSRREETLKRLENTRRNLERVQDILAELKPRLRSLERQAKRAQEYDQVRQDLLQSLRIWYGFQWYQLQQAITEATWEAKGHQKTLNGLHSRQRSVEVTLSEVRSRIGVLREKIAIASNENRQVFASREALARRAAVARERLGWLEDQKVVLESEEAASSDSLSSLDKRIHSTRQELDRYQASLGSTHADQHSLSEDNEEILGESPLDRLERLKDEAARNIAEQGKLEATIEQRIKDEQVMEKALVEDTGRLEESRLSLGKNQEQLNKAMSTGSEAERILAKGKTRRDELSTALESLDQRRVDLEDDQRGQERKLSGLDAQLELLKSDEDAIRRAQQNLEKAVEDGELNGWISSLSELMEIPEMYAEAVRAGLGSFDDALVFTDRETTSEAMDWWKKFGSIRRAFFAVKSASNSQRVEMEAMPGYVGNAADLVRVDAEFSGAIEPLLSRILITESDKLARKIAAQVPTHARVVTLDGNLYYPAGHIVYRQKSGAISSQISPTDLQVSQGQEQTKLENIQNSLKDTQLSLHSKEVELTEAVRLDESAEEDSRQVKEAIRAAELEVQAGEEKLSELERIIAEKEGALNAIKDLREDGARDMQALEDRARLLANQTQESTLEIEGNAGALERATAEAQRNVARNAIESTESRLGGLVEERSQLLIEIEDRKSRLQSNEMEQKELQEELETTDEEELQFKGALDKVGGELEEFELSLADNEKKRSEAELEEREIRAELSEAERVNSNAQILLARREEEQASLRRRIEDDFGLVSFEYEGEVASQEPLPLKGYVEHLPKVTEIPAELELQVNRQRAQLRRVGAVNPEAKKEYEEVSQRVEFMTNQLEDLRQAEEQIQEVIAELDLLMEREFRHTFEAVAVEFKRVFQRLFGGGAAQLLLTDPDDLTGTGIEIEARLPGRRTQGLALLSGGERSLTACALVFALLKVSPTPFCLLDEVDAMLDEANVIRFCDMLQELSADTQFVVITHNRQTVQTAEIVYGISMQADSASKVISLKLDEAEKVLAD